MKRRRRRPVQVPLSAFAGCRFTPESILVAVLLYLRYNLSYRALEELLGERRRGRPHQLVPLWVQRFAPQLVDVAGPVAALGR